MAKLRRSTIGPVQCVTVDAMLVEAALGAVIELTISRILKGLRAVRKESRPDEQDVSARLRQHLIQTVNWTSRVYVPGMERAHALDTTIPLFLVLGQRRYRSRRRAESTYPESYLLEENGHFLLQGNLGSGKTTTIQRLTQHLLFDEAADGDGLFDYPFVIRVREIADGDRLDCAIARILGLPYELRETRVRRELLYAPHMSEADLWATNIEALCGTRPLLDVIAELMDATNAVVMIDGLDEAKASVRELLHDHVRNLAEKLTSAKVIATCRTNSLSSHMQPLEIVELCPLDAEQIRAIAAQWLATPDQFLSDLQNLPHRDDIADRPLLLAQVLIIYERDGRLPERPKEIYERLVALAITDWDKWRKIERPSMYARFQREQKYEFLAAVAFHLTYRRRTRIFRRQDFVEAYAALHRKFKLPRRDADAVAAELESHTGLISEAGDGWYEFSHLSLQEYLCARHMVGHSLSTEFRAYFDSYPEPLAVAVALSPTPGAWFAGLVFGEVVTATANVRPFLARILLERPAWDVGAMLGAAVMRLYFLAALIPEAVDLLDRICEDEDVRDSIHAAWQYYGSGADRTTAKRRYRTFTRVGQQSEFIGLELPDEVCLPIAIFRKIGRKPPR
jgi:hypothetical protein